MCGRFVSTAGPDRIAAYFDGVLPVTVPDEVATSSLGANYNVAPTQDVYAVVGADPGARVEVFHWGLIPSWATDRKIASRMINARAETLAEKPVFKGLFAKRRCIVTMDGFYEWRPGAEGGPVNAKGKLLKQPMFIHAVDDQPLAIAGLWTAWKDPADADGRWLHSTTLITTAANATMSQVHDRMPAILTSDRWQDWLDPANHDTEALQPMLDGGPPELLTMQPVSVDVNNVRNNRPDLIDALSR